MGKSHTALLYSLRFRILVIASPALFSRAKQSPRVQMIASQKDARNGNHKTTGNEYIKPRPSRG
jgi:hypothetical protein